MEEEVQWLLFEADAAPRGKCVNVNRYKFSGPETSDPNALLVIAERNWKIADRLNSRQLRFCPRIYDRYRPLPCISDPDMIANNQPTLAPITTVHDSSIAAIDVDQRQRSRFGIGYCERP